jgi:uncharacterized membrane protein
MTWARWYAVKSYLMSTVWIAPVIAFAFEQALFRVFYSAQIDPGGIPGFVFDRAGTLAAADYVIGTATAFMVFTFGSLLVAIQVASGQLTPRIIATALLRNRPIRWAVGAFVFALLLAVAVKTRVDTIPAFLVSLMGIFGLLNILVFMFLIDYAARLLRPISILRRIANQGLAVIEDVYPLLFVEATNGTPRIGGLDAPTRTIIHPGSSAIIIAINLPALLAAARRADCAIEILPRVGDFVGVEEPLLALQGPGAATIDARVLRGQVAFGAERTIEQDSTFAVRVIVDIALKALSPAINDPTTAVLAIDQLQRLLRAVGQRNLRDAPVLDDDGRLRLIHRTPNWNDFVQLALTEIRHHGTNIQVQRRLRAMIETVMASVPDPRRPALRQELALLDLQVDRLYGNPEDQALARVPDTQGLGGASGR